MLTTYIKETGFRSEKTKITKSGNPLIIINEFGGNISIETENFILSLKREQLKELDIKYK